MLRSRSKDRAEKMPGPSYMSAQQMADYLQELRSNRVQRPTGARPPPASFVSSRNASKMVPDAAVTNAEPFPEKTYIPYRSSSAQSHRRTASSASNNSNLDQNIGRPLARPPAPRVERNFSGSSMSSNSSAGVPYKENGTRLMERMEAHSLRLALEQHDMEEEQRLFDAAQDEAAELVWKHQNPNAPYANPDAPYRYPDRLRQSSHGRSQSWSRVQDVPKAEPITGNKRHSIANASRPRSRNSSGQSSRVPSDGSVKLPNVDEDAKEEDFSQTIQPPREKVQTAPKISAVPSSVFPDPKNRRKSSGSKRKGSGSLFANPEDKIYEEPEEVKPVPLSKPPSDPVALAVRRNPFARVKFAAEGLSRAQTDPMLATKGLHRYEIHKNPPTQSRNPGYTSNPVPNSQSQQLPNPASENENDATKMKDGVEIRGDDIRAATSMKLKDRSAKLPTPTMVSDSPGRPIVSFQQDWKPKEVELKMERSAPLAPNAPRETPLSNITPYTSNNTTSAPIPVINVAEAPSNPRSQQQQPPIPIICVPDEPVSNRPPPSIEAEGPKPPIPTISVNCGPPPSIPSINVSDAACSTRPVPSISVHAAPVPTISVGDSGSNQRSSTRPLPNPGSRVKAAIEAFSKSAFTGKNSRSHWTPSVRHNGALCSNCALPISGRIVSAAGSRFHPECFMCYHCHERLECVAFYPEPESKRDERIARIRARMNGEDVPLPAGTTPHDAARLEAADGDESMRFYCHLDYHEFFSPRCKSCKTPIEGEVVVACGAEWHVGHFFCAQCGDPFDAQTPFVEKDGYAWCVNCHTNRYSTKCRRCRKPVTDVVVKALDCEWHEECFVCTECGGPFKDGKYFLRGEDEDPVCVRCEERRLKA